MKIARLNVSAALLAEALRLPPGTEVVGCKMNQIHHSSIEFQVVHDDLDEVKPGEMVPSVDVVIHTPSSTFEKYR
jgi:hypothetical protein